MPEPENNHLFPTPLYALLLEHFPRMRDTRGNLNVAKLSRSIKMSPEGVYK